MSVSVKDLDPAFQGEGQKDGIEIWRIENFLPVPVSKSSHGKFFTGDSYVILKYFGLGSETWKTTTDVPDPYGIEVGNPADIPDGYEERWMVNVHAIDTRGAEDKLGCTECRCDLYNVTADEYGDAIPPTYNGGLRCCHDDARCKVKEGFHGVRRSLYLKYTVKYVDWDTSIVPVKIYIKVIGMKKGRLMNDLYVMNT